MAETPSFEQIVSRFISSIYALRIFSEELGELAEQHDQKTTKKITRDMLVFLDVPENVINEIDLDVEIAEKEKEVKEDKKAAEEKIKNEISDMLTEVVKTPEKAYEFFSLMKSLRKTSPMQGRLLRQGALINLLIFFENLISDLIHKYYSLFPAALPSEERLLSLSDLRGFGSIDEAEKWLVGKEVDSVLRGDTKSQLEYLSKRPKVNVEPINKHIDNLIEISQRRNIFVHNRGLANKIYIANVSRNFLDTYKIQDGEPVEIDQDYLLNAINIVYSIGIILVQQCWRKWTKDEIKRADSLLSDLSFDALSEGNYELVENFAEYASSVDFAVDRSFKVVVINWAIALKQKGKLEDLENLINGFDWSSAALEFQIALWALRNDEDNLSKMLPKATGVGVFSEVALREWPLFKEFRNSDKFEEVMNKCFPKEVL